MDGNSHALRLVFQLISYRRLTDTNTLCHCFQIQKWPSVAVRSDLPPLPKVDQATVVVLQKNQILLGPKIGQGTFGVVHKGSTTVGGKDVAIKILRTGSLAALQELKTMSKLIAHANLLRIIGMCLEPAMLVTELAAFGNLKTHLEDKVLCLVIFFRIVHGSMFAK